MRAFATSGLILCLCIAFLAGCATARQPVKPAEPVLDIPLELSEQQNATLAAIWRAHEQEMKQAVPSDMGKWAEFIVCYPELTPPAKQEPVKPVLLQPRTLLVVGDSLAVGVGMGLREELQGKEIDLRERGKTSTGLNSPKFYNWEQQLRTFLRQDSPDVVVGIMSANDAHNGSGSESWRQSYKIKAHNFMKIATDAGVPVFIVGLPPMGKDDFSRRAYVANQALQDACQDVPGSFYVDAWSLFAGDQGQFLNSKNINGQVLSLRANDGVHFTMTGYRLLARHILDQISNTYQH